jgi:DNA-binding SARP family transcriptional activator
MHCGVQAGEPVELRFRVLGSLDVAAGAQRLAVGGIRQQVVLAMLLLGANRLVTVNRLLEAIYGEDLPPTSRFQVTMSICNLRRVFAEHVRTEIISTGPQGYVARVGPGELDSEQFERLVAGARAAHDEGRVGQAVAMYRDGLRLWRGAALEGTENELIRAAAIRLDEQRITVNEERIDLELDLGRHCEMVGELTELIREYPLRERLRGQLMLALYGCNRVAEALRLFQQTRRFMLSELGLEPSDRLKRLEHAILAADPVLEARQHSVVVTEPRVRIRPNLLPTDTADFTGRADQIAQVRRLLLDGGDVARSAVPVVAVEGIAGAGKTAFALHAAHGMADSYPDGQLFADLHAGASRPANPTQVLGLFLRALGVPGSQIPDGLDERASMYRGLLADRRVLVLLDNAATESQVGPLLPGSARQGVIVTSRTWLSGLAGATHIELDALDRVQSLALLARMVGSARIQAQREAAEGLAAVCDHLPLALRIAGARLSARPHWSVQHLLDRLADEAHRLDELSHGDLGIRPAVAPSYDSATEQAKRLLRRLALLDVPVFSSSMGAALLNQPLHLTEDLFEELVNARLIESAGTETDVCHYRFRSLIRIFALECLAAEETAAERKAALERVLG